VGGTVRRAPSSHAGPPACSNGSGSPLGSTTGTSTVSDGPAVVALGGGHGLSVVLRAARRYAGTITGIVSVADDGGSSGRLRRDFGGPAPGDPPPGLGALAGSATPWPRAFR